LHCLLHVKELKITNIELKRQIGDYWKAAGRLEIQQSQPRKSEINEA